MAELEQKEVGKKERRIKKKSTRLDLTPMVDLGFLLVTFFMLTTNFSKPQTMEINMPPKEGGRSNIPPEKALQIVLGDEDKLFWFRGYADEPVDPFTKTDFSSGGIRKVLIEKNNSIDKMVVLLKPTDNARYKNIVDIIDELNIAGIKRYAIVNLEPEDIDLMKQNK